MPYYPPYYNYCPPGYNNNSGYNGYSQSVVPSYNNGYQAPPYYNFPVYQAGGYPNSGYSNQYAYKVSFTKVDAPNGEDFNASASNTTLKFLDGEDGNF